MGPRLCRIPDAIDFCLLEEDTSIEFKHFTIIDLKINYTPASNKGLHCRMDIPIRDDFFLNQGHILEVARETSAIWCSFHIFWTAFIK